MAANESIRATPWDSLVFGTPTWEILEYTAAALRRATIEPGIYSIKVDPLADKALLHQSGFYYCDSLIEPYCTESSLNRFYESDISISEDVDADAVLSLCKGAFKHDRFHRDFNVSGSCADLRYNNWLAQLLAEERVYGLYWKQQLAGFIAYRGNSLVLHAIGAGFRGKGLAKYWWSAVCSEMLAENAEVSSSISLTNTAVLNLYTSLGFRFRDAVDCYHFHHISR